MFKAMMFGFLVGIFASQQVQQWVSQGTAGTQQELHSLLRIDAYDRISAALR